MWVELLVVVAAALLLLDLYLRKQCSRLVRMSGDTSQPDVIPYEDPLVSILKVLRDIAVVKPGDTMKSLLEGTLEKDTNGSRTFKGVQSLLLNKHIVTLWRPDLVREVLFDRTGTFQKADLGAISAFAGESILQVEGEDWKRQKSIISPAFRHESIRCLLPSMCDVADQLIAALATDMDDIVMHEWTKKATLEIIGRAGLGHTFHALSTDVTDETTTESLRKYEAAATEMINPIHLFETLSKLTGASKKLKKAFDDFHGFLQDLIDEKRRECDAEASDILGLLVQAHGGTDEATSLSGAELLDNLAIFFLAGHETTASALATAVQLLAEHPEYQQRAYDEVREAIEQDGELTYEAVSGMQFLKQCIQEALRMGGPAPMTMREAKTDGVVGGYHIPKGVLLMCNFASMHYDPAQWEKPEVFDPDRWTPGRKHQRERCVYAPFSLGTRQCIGNNFAMLEMKVLLAKLLLAYRVTPSAQSPLWSAYAGVVIQPNPVCKVSLASR